MSKRIFISYRRDDAAGQAGRLFDALKARFGLDRLFMDVDAIEPGLDFLDAIESALRESAVVLVIIGRQWLSLADARGRRRLDNPDDLVQHEIRLALERKVRVIPVLVAGAGMPSSDDLPERLRPLARRNASELRDSRWGDDVGSLIASLQRVLDAPAARAIDPVRLVLDEPELPELVKPATNGLDNVTAQVASSFGARPNPVLPVPMPAGASAPRVSERERLILALAGGAVVVAAAIALLLWLAATTPV